MAPLPGIIVEVVDEVTLKSAVAVQLSLLPMVCEAIGAPPRVV